MEWILSHWYLWDWLADEQVQDWLSIAVGFLAACPLYIALHWIPFGIFLTRPKWYVWAIPLGMLVIACALIAFAVSYYVHDQILWPFLIAFAVSYYVHDQILWPFHVWYTTPLGPALDLGVPQG